MSENKDKVFSNTVINWYPGHMAKTKRLIVEKGNLIDIVYELVDARIPFSSKIKNIYDVVGDKPKIIIMTKKDLCDEKVTKVWINYYEHLGTPVLLLDLNDGDGINKIVSLTHELTKDIQEKRRSKGMKDKSVRALVVGIPNVGKSTLINKMCRRRVANVGNSPGVTKNLTWLKTDYGIELLDTPGILWPKLDNETVALNLAAFTAIKQEILPINDVAYYIIESLKKYYPNVLDSVYHVDNSLSVMEIIDTIANNIGAIKMGEVDYNRVCTKIVNDIKLESIKGITFDRK